MRDKRIKGEWGWRGEVKSGEAERGDAERSERKRLRGTDRLCMIGFLGQGE